MSTPILYSLQHCPYAMRARMGIFLSKQTVLIRAITLKNKPAEMLAVSEKGTVPILVVDESVVLDQSLDIMLWALHKSDPLDLLCSAEPDALSAMLALIGRNDDYFVDLLEKYKFYGKRYDFSQLYYRQQCESFLIHLEDGLHDSDYLMGTRPSLADYAIFPFIRQFSRVDRKWFRQAPYSNLKRWLNTLIQNPTYTKVMAHYPFWNANKEDYFFGNN